MPTIAFLGRDLNNVEEVFVVANSQTVNGLPVNLIALHLFTS